MTQLNHPVEPFGEVNVYKQKNGTLDIVATVLMVPDVEGARAGLAIDASASMKKMYGVSGVVGGAFLQATGIPNLVEPVVRTMAGYLANFSSTGKVQLIYWACNPDGSAIEEIGQFTAEESAQVVLKGPKKFPWGRGTKLLPPVRYFVENAFQGAPWAICVFITDGVIEDLADVKAYCLQFAQQIAAGQRAFIKLVLIGVGEEVDESQMEELDDMFEGSGIKDPQGRDIDLWDHKLASEMQKIEEIFAEVVSEDTVIVSSGRIVDQAGRVAKEYADGVPALLRFTLPADATAFVLEFPGGKVTQDIREALGRP
jgi:hypothetical protein